MVLEDLIRLIGLRLQMFGYTVTEEDKSTIEYQAEKAAQYVCNYCNFKKCPDDIPGALKFVTVDYAIGEFLEHKKTFAPNALSMLNLDIAVKQIKAGDMDTTFAVGEGSKTHEQRLDAFINYLKSYGKTELMRHRRIKW